MCVQTATRSTGPRLVRPDRFLRFIETCDGSVKSDLVSLAAALVTFACVVRFVS